MSLARWVGFPLASGGWIDMRPPWLGVAGINEGVQQRVAWRSRSPGFRRTNAQDEEKGLP